MVGVAQLVEHWVVAPVVAGSSPVTHPIFSTIRQIEIDYGSICLYFCGVPIWGKFGATSFRSSRPF